MYNKPAWKAHSEHRHRVHIAQEGLKQQRANPIPASAIVLFFVFAALLALVLFYFVH